MNIALVAHDGRKKEMIEWVTYNHEKLSKHNIYATGTTGRLIQEIEIKTEIPSPMRQIEGTDMYVSDSILLYKTETPFKDKVTCLLSGPLGGDQQIGAMIAEGKIDALIFFCDNLIMQGHQNDVSALTRLSALYPVAFAMNRTTADMILTSPLFDNKDYKRIIPKCIDDYKNRTL